MVMKHCTVIDLANIYPNLKSLQLFPFPRQPHNNIDLKVPEDLISGNFNEGLRIKRIRSHLKLDRELQE